MQIGITNFFTKSVCRTLLLKIAEFGKSFDHNLNHAATKNTYRIFQTMTLLEVPDPQRSIQQSKNTLHQPGKTKEIHCLERREESEFKTDTQD